MKLRSFFACLFALASMVAFAAPKHNHADDDHKPKHGGIVVESPAMDFELVAKADVITIYLRDHGKPAKAAGGSGKLTVLSGSDKIEAALTPAGDDRLEARGTFKTGPGTKLVATITLPGKKPMNVRFSMK
jgi:hypothetical protein